MENTLKGLKPTALWKYFEEICKIPHPSKHEEKIVKYVETWAKELKLKTHIDKIGNVIISKPATAGMENRKGIILQAHLDMVPQKNNDTVHDFQKDAIKPYIDGEWVKAKGTTLGSDNGIGVAAAMAVLEDKNLVHGPIEVLLTIDEETGMTGAFGLQDGLLKGDILMNLDSEDEGELCVGCAGGTNANIKFHYSEEPLPDKVEAYKLTVKGLKGGHSGVDIALERANSNKIINRILWHGFKHYGLLLAGIDGGSLRNAIPRESMAVITLPQNKTQEFKNFIKEFISVVTNEYKGVETDLTILIEKTESPAFVIDKVTTSNLLNAVYATPNGVIRDSQDMKGLVETSTNLATIKSQNKTIDIQCLLRSSVDSAKDDLEKMFVAVYTLAKAEITLTGKYPGWKPNMDSSILLPFLDLTRCHSMQISNPFKSIFIFSLSAIS